MVESSNEFIAIKTKISIRRFLLCQKLNYAPLLPKEQSNQHGKTSLRFKQQNI